MPGGDEIWNQELQLVCLLIGRVAVNLLCGFFFKNKDAFVPIRNTSLHAAEAISKSKKEWRNSVHDVIYTNVFHISVVSSTWKSKFAHVFIS